MLLERDKIIWGEKKHFTIMIFTTSVLTPKLFNSLTTINIIIHATQLAVLESLA